MREPDVDERSAAEVHTPRNAMPEQHGKHPGYAKDQRKGQKVPFLAQKIYVGIAKELHRFS
jgi:hypothetical protein